MFFSLERIQNSIIARSARVLTKADRRKIFYVITIQIFLGGLDLIGVATFGVLGALAISGIQSQSQGSRVHQVLSMLGIEGLRLQEQAAILGILAVAFMLVRTLVSMFFTRRILFFLSRRGASISTILIRKLLNLSLLEIQEKKVQEQVYAVTSGVTVVTVGVLGALVSLISDFSLLLIMGAGLLVLDPIIALTSTLVFSAIGILLYRTLRHKAEILGRSEATFNIQSNEKVVEVLSSYREAVVKNRRPYYASIIGDIRWRLADTQAELAFMPNISKYIIESTVLLGLVVISGIEFALMDARHAIATLTVFLASSTRIAPAVLRVQQSAISVKGSIGAAGPTLDFIDSYKDQPEVDESDIEALDFSHSGFTPGIEIKDVDFKYPTRAELAISNINMRVNPGELIAIVGSSGAGKSTLVDLLLGLLEPSKGSINLSGMSPIKAIKKWPGAISYVPQEVLIVDGSIVENIRLGFPHKISDGAQIQKVIERSQLAMLVTELEDGIESQVGERGSKLSGGQKQRLGIARSLYTNPRLLVLDEATSSLDGQTEAAITNALNELKGSITIIVIAHRISTVREADRVIYLEKGKILAQGSFEEVRNSVPDFDKQAKLNGI